MKICNVCCEEKPLSEFHYTKAKEKHQSMCKKCFSKYCMDRWTKKKLDAIAYKGGKCCICGYDKYHGALEFHHIDPITKDFEWYKLRLRTPESIYRELDKCLLLCANCHRETHAKQNLAEPGGLEPPLIQLLDSEVEAP